MYGNSNLAQTTDAPRASQPITVNMMERVSKATEYQANIINEIQSKLHSYFNKREPEQPMQNEAKQVSMNDFTGALSQQFDRIDENNSRLQKILNHLSEII
jgi:hypothetical protein